MNIAQVAIENKKLITKELEIMYLEWVLKALPRADRNALVSSPLVGLFGFKFDSKAPIEEIRQDAILEVEERLERYRSSTNKVRSVRSTFGQTTKLLIGSAVVGLISVAIGAYFLTRRKLRN